MLNFSVKTSFLIPKGLVLFFLLLSYLTSFGQSNTLISSGSYIIDMGVQPQTVNNALKPYGLVYELISKTYIPVDWVIKEDKTSQTASDFIHNGKEYRGGPFVIKKEFRSEKVDQIISNWVSNNSGLTVDTTISSLIVPVFKILSFTPIWTLDKKNGKIAQAYLKTAGIPDNAYNWQDPQQLNCCNDLFAMPHADPVWSTHSNLLDWNNDIASGGCGGWIWAACHAVSALENAFDPNNPSDQLNFLSEKTSSATGSGKWADNSLLLWGDHGDGTGNYAYNSNYYGRPEMQFLSDLTPATENGSEQIFIPHSKWRNSTLIAVEDPNHPDIPLGTSSKAAKLAFGRSFGDDGNGKVMYEAGHNHGKGTSQSNIAAQRAFLNFSMESAGAKAPTITTNIPSSMSGGNTYNLTSTVVGSTGPFKYFWSAPCDGKFNNPKLANPTFTPKESDDIVNCALTLQVIDACGRISFTTSSLVINSGPQPPLAIKDSAFCNPWATVTLNALTNDSDPNSDPITASSVSNTTTSKGVFTIAANGTVTYDPSSSFTSGIDTLTYQVCDTTGLCDTAIVVIEVNYPDSDNDGIYDNVDIDDDNDGITDVNESGVSGKDPSGDEDNDDVPNFADATPGTGVTWVDANNDGVNDNFDYDGDGIADHIDIDADNDGITDALEANGGVAPTNYNVSTGMITGAVGANGLPDAIETGTGPETGVSVYTPGDKDGDGNDDYKDIDSDNDGITDAIESNGGVAPTNYNSSTGTIVTTVGSNGWPDSADPSDGGTALPITNTDADSFPDYLDIDADNDGIVDNIEAQSTSGFTGPSGTDTDGDGWDDAYDPDNSGTPITINNHDGTDTPDYIDLDTDNDGVPDIREGHDNDSEGTGDWDTGTENDVVDNGENYGGGVDTLDVDNDGLLDLWDPDYITCPAAYDADQDQGKLSTENGGCAAIQNTDGEDDRDWRDTDDDNDGILTSDELTDVIGTVGVKDYLESPCSFGEIAEVINDSISPNSLTGYIAYQNYNLQRGLVNNGYFAWMEELTDSLVYSFSNLSAAGSVLKLDVDWWGQPDLKVYLSTDGSTYILDGTISNPSTTTNSSDCMLVAYTTSNSFSYVKFKVSQQGWLGFDNIYSVRDYVNCNSALTTLKDSATTYQNNFVTIDIQDNDVNNTATSTLNVTLLDSLLNNGSVTVNTNGTVDYLPNSSFTGLDSFYYQACSDGNVCDTALVVVLVQASPCGNGKYTSVSTLTGAAGYADSIVSASNVSNTGACLGALSYGGNHSGTTFPKNSTGGVFVVRLGHWVPENETVTIYFNGHSDPAKQGKFDITSSTQQSGTFGGTSSYNTPKQHALDSATYTVPTGGARYLKITQTDNGNDVTGFNGFRYSYAGYSVFTCTNPAPIAINDTVSTTSNTQKISSIATNDSDPLGDELVYATTAVTALTNGGTLSINTAGSVTFTPANNWTGTDSFQYQVCDTATPSKCDTAWYFVTVPNRSPVAVNDYKDVEAGFSVDVNLFTNDTEPDGQDLSLTIPATSVNGGFVTVGNNGEITYLPGVNQSGKDSVQYIICDGQTPNLCDTAWAVFNVSAYINDPPIANRDTGNTEKNVGIDIAVLTNDTEPEDEDLDVTAAGTNGANGVTAAGGTASVNYDNTINYDLPANWFGTDSFQYIIVDEQGNADTTTVLVNVEDEVNNPPIAQDDRLVAIWNTSGGSGETTQVKPFENDYDPDGTLDSSAYVNPINLVGVEIVTSPSKGSATWDVTQGEFKYTPTAAVPDGTLDSFYYKVCDDGNPSPVLCDSAWVRVTIYSGNDAPTADKDIDSSYVNQPVYVDVKSNDSDPENSPNLEYYISSADSASNGSVYFTSSGKLAYTPDSGFVGIDTVIYTLCDDGGAIEKCDTALVVITVLNNDVIATFDESSTLLNTSKSIDIRANDIDPDGHQFWITDLAPNFGFTSGDTANGAATALGGAVTINNNGTPTDPTDDIVLYSPPSNVAGVVDTFWYKACDTIAAPNQGCDDTYVLITIAENAAPIALNDKDTTPINTTIEVDVLANDYDLTGELDATSVDTAAGGSPKNGSITLNPTTGKITYTPDTDFIGTDTFEYYVCDNVISPNTKCDTAYVFINVFTQYTLAINDDNSTLEDKPVSGNVITNDFDPEGNVQSFGSFLNATQTGNITTGATLAGTDEDGNAVANAGAIVFAADGSYTFTPATGFTGRVTVPYSICDDGNPQACYTAELTINVDSTPDPTNANDNGIYTNDDDIVTYGDAVSSNALTNDGDPQADSIYVNGFTYDSNGDGTLNATGTLAIATTVAGIDNSGNAVAYAGSLTVNGDGSYTFTPTAGFNGNVVVIYEACDTVSGSNKACQEANINIVVYADNGPSNDPPLAGDDFGSTTKNEPSTGSWIGNDYDYNGDSIAINGSSTYIDENNISGNGTTAISTLTSKEGGSVEFYADGTYKYTPPSNYSGPDQVGYEICDKSTATPQPLCDSATMYFVVSDLVRDYGDLNNDTTKSVYYGDAWNVFVDADDNGIPEGSKPIWLGSFVTDETETQGNATATGDSDDGLIFPAGLDTVNANTFKVIVNSTVGGTQVHFKLYFDWDEDGVFDSTYVGSGIANSPDTINVAVNPPVGENGSFGVRLRVGLDPAEIAPTGGVNNGETEDYMGALIPVPVELTYFKAEKVGSKDALLTWETASELNNDRFEIYRSVDEGASFKKIDEVQGAGTSNEIIAYEYLDLDAGANGIACYNLKQVDFDGAYEWTVPTCLEWSNQNGIKVYPNPANDAINVQVAGSKLSSTVEIISIAGIVLETKELKRNEILIFNVEGYKSGVYLVRVKTNSQITMHRILVSH